MIFLDTWGNELVIEQKAGVVKKNGLFYLTLPCYVHFFVKLTGSSFFISFIFLFLIPCPGRHLVRAKTYIDRWIGVVKNKKKICPSQRFFLNNDHSKRWSSNQCRVFVVSYYIADACHFSYQILFSVMCSD